MENGVQHSIDFTLEEHEKINAWTNNRAPEWPELHLTLGYKAHEMYSVVEKGWQSPTFFIWKTPSGITVTSWSMGPGEQFPSIESFLEALSIWSISNQFGERLTLTPSAMKIIKGSRLIWPE